MKPTRAFVVAWIAFALPVLVLAAVLWRGPGSADAQQQKFVWKVQSAWPATNLLHVSAVELAKMVEEMSGGRLKWEMSAAGTVVPAFEVLDAVNRGIIDATHAWPGYWAGKNSAAGLSRPVPAGRTAWTARSTSDGCMQAAGSSSTASCSRRSSR